MKASVVSYMWLSASNTGKSTMGFGMATSVMTEPLSPSLQGAAGRSGFQLRRQYYGMEGAGATIVRFPAGVAADLRPCKALHRCCTRTASSRPIRASGGSPAHLYERTKALPIVSPHGHCDPAALADDIAFGDPATELVTKDHYVLRMLYSQGVPLESLGVQPLDGAPCAGATARQVWRELADHYHLFRGTPSKLWLDHTLAGGLGRRRPRCGPRHADAVYDEISARLPQDDFRPRALFERFGSSSSRRPTVPSTRSTRTRGSADPAGPARVVPTFRPDDVVDPDRSGFHARTSPRSAELTDADTSTWAGYLDALRSRRAAFVAAGATASDHGHPSPATADLSPREAEDLFARIAAGRGAAGRRRAVPRPDAGRDGGHEPGRRARAAAPCRCVARPQSDASRRVSARTRAPTSPERWTTWAASSHCSTGSATSRA